MNISSGFAMMSAAAVAIGMVLLFCGIWATVSYTFYRKGPVWGYGLIAVYILLAAFVVGVFSPSQ